MTTKRHESFNYVQFEDKIISKLCEACDHSYDDLDEEVDECPECGGELLNETSLEGESCSGCKADFDMWEQNVWQHKENNNYLCNDCLEQL